MKTLLIYLPFLSGCFVQSAVGTPLSSRTEGDVCKAIGPLSILASNHGTTFQLAASNESYVLGWQLSGLFGKTTFQTSLCNNLDKGTSKLRKTGIDPFLVTLPLCNRLNCNMSNDRANVFASLISYVGGLFVTEILAAIEDKPANWLVLCNTINPILAGIFFRQTTNLVSTVCDRAGASPPPDPDQGSTNVDPRAPSMIHGAATKLLAWHVLALLPHRKDVEHFCHSYINGSEDVRSQVALLDLKPDSFTETICVYAPKAPPTVNIIREEYFEHGAEIFAETLWNLSDSLQVRQFICKGYEKGSLEHFAKPKVYVGPAVKVFVDKIATHSEEVGV